MATADVIQLLSLLLAVVSAMAALLGWKWGQAERRLERAQLSEQAAEEARRLRAQLDRDELRFQQRRNEVVSWGMETISAMQGAVCLLQDELVGACTPEDATRLSELRHKLSILMEKGRIYFRNQGTRLGPEQEKPAAYLGLRPAILDQLLIMIGACRDGAAGPKGNVVLETAEWAEKEFVSLLNLEVGRTEQVSEKAALGGQSSPYMKAMADARERLRRRIQK